MPAHKLPDDLMLLKTVERKYPDLTVRWQRHNIYSLRTLRTFKRGNRVMVSEADVLNLIRQDRP
jgi:hypothetical protein